MSKKVSLFVSGIIVVVCFPGIVFGSLDIDDDRFVRTASLVGQYKKGRISWSGKYELPSHTSSVSFVAPLKTDTKLEMVEPDYMTLVRNSRGQITGFEAPDSYENLGDIRFKFTRSQVAEDYISPPILEDSGSRFVQRIALQDVRLKLTDASNLVEYPGYMAPKGFEEAWAESAEDCLAELSTPPTQTIYLRGAPNSDGRLRGEVIPESEFKARTMGVLGAVLFVLVVLGLLGYRQLGERAEAERAEAYLKKNDDALADELGSEIDKLES
jgi:hypothetical protein